MLTQKKKLLF